MKKFLISLILVIIILALIGLNGWLIYSANSAKSEEVKNPVLSLDIKDYGTVKIELYPEYAPNTVKNIIALANNGYYNGKIFYGSDDVAIYVGRNSKGESENPTMSDIDKSITPASDESADENSNQSTDGIPEGVENVVTDGSAESTDSSTNETSDEDYEYEIDGEFVANGFKQNTLKNEKGVVSLVRADYTKQMSTLTKQSYNSGSSQFTIAMTDDAKDLNGLYASFGRISEGMDIIEKIYGLDIKTEDSEDSNTTTAPTTEDESINAFANPPVISSATVETYGVNYGLPETHKAFDYSQYLQDLMMQYYSTNQ